MNKDHPYGAKAWPDINKELVKEMPHGESFVETLIRSMGDTFSKSYYQAKGILPTEQTNMLMSLTKV